MTIPRVKPAGWGFGEQLTSAQCTELDEHIVRAVDGQDGGAFNPTAPITIGGSGVTLNSPDNILGGTLTVDGDIQLDGVLEVGNGLGSITFEGTTGRPLLGSRLLYRTSWNAYGVPADWSISATDGVCATTSVSYLNMALDHLPHGSTLLEVNLRVAGVLSGATMPTTMPTLEIWKRSVTSGAATQIGTTTTDATANQAAFEAIHLLTVTGFSETIDRVFYVYYARVSSPNGGNTDVGFYALPPTSSFGVTQMDDGAA